ncbi:MAG: indole-3-glycerol phosphate synthase TrpC [Pseudomonadales bacterium]|nr:indole-3-glycerol phosphate synthase TrpC [Pseudomonadales bacterium]
MRSPTVLDAILHDKKDEVVRRRQRRSAVALQESLPEARPVRGFTAALQRTVAAGRAAVIAEIKKASPSRGVIRDPFLPADIAMSYERGGASCLSVLTDEKYFQGSDDYLVQARSSCTLPVLRKDFIVDPYQILEARILGADCILLIAAALSVEQLKEYHLYAQSLGLDVLIEVHDEAELQNALPLSPALLGINNRNLHTFAVSLEVTLQLQELVPATSLLVTESGISCQEDIKRMRQAGVHAFLVGESLMRAPDPGQALQVLIS